MECSSAYLIFLGAFFILGYAVIALESFFRLDKGAVALGMSVVMWATYFMAGCQDHAHALNTLAEHVFNVSQIIFFLLGALVIVELINAHQGFGVLTRFLRVSSKQSLFWIIGIITFFLSSILDNLTTTIVMVSIISQLLPKNEERLIIGGAIVIAANAGGAWTPIGDVTTTMLWIGGQIGAVKVLSSLFLPSIVCLIVALAMLSPRIKGNLNLSSKYFLSNVKEPHGTCILILGLFLLMFVPVFKILTGLPPFMGIFFGISVLWIATDLFHSNKTERDHLRMLHIFKKVDLASIFFFTGILLSVDVLQSTGILQDIVNLMNSTIPSVEVIAATIGLLSAIVDNVPLVAATMGMYDLKVFPVDSNLWQLIAYCAGTGGSILIIGSAAGVVYMGMEKVSFLWYLKRISFAALVSYFAGIAVYQFQSILF